MIAFPTCFKCNVNPRSKRGTYCSECWKKLGQADYQKHKVKRNSTSRAWTLKNHEKMKNYWRTWKTGTTLSLEAERELLRKQGYRCAICAGSNDTTDRSLALDHNHTTKKIRGFLCGRCNKGIGLFKDSTQLLANAMLYLEQTNG